MTKQKILKQPLNFGGRLFETGENIQGHIPLDMVELLQGQGVLEEIEEAQEEPDATSDITDTTEKFKTVEELAEHVKTLDDAESVQALLAEEQGKEKPRAGAIKLLEARLKEIQDERV
ncbi:hypothetical protein HW560_15685 [Paenibacillus sp. E222]|uniref:hypothetical protein n=1 Tax=Paenibacillus sp. E222 TaxID=2748863 RepID=UPI0015C60E76|nr:hypothetical protein [Paenibacillus sp. E222]QLG39388.1 hypothetical protein HW560_15685 [Paenibacillus sp. E222]